VDDQKERSGGNEVCHGRILRLSRGISPVQLPLPLGQHT
jgi:hypothetical protein